MKITEVVKAAGAALAGAFAKAVKNKSANDNKAALVGGFKQAYPGQIIKGADGRCYQGRMMGGGRGGAKLGWYPVQCPPGM